MEYENCILAIKKLREDASSSNVHLNKDDCKCPRVPSSCDWVGNEMRFACLSKEYDNPQKVYSGLNSGGIGQIILPERTQK